jgi:hypothetical protein
VRAPMVEADASEVALSRPIALLGHPRVQTTEGCLRRRRELQVAVKASWGTGLSRPRDSLSRIRPFYTLVEIGGSLSSN